MNPEAQPDVVWLRLAPGAHALRVVRDVGRQLGLAEVETVRRRDLMGYQQPGEVLNVRQVDQLPLILAVLMGVLAAGVLAHVLLTGTRARRRDLAILVTFGFVRRQIRGAVAIQATTLALIAAVIGLPLGVVLGRVIWRGYATSIGVVPEPSVPVAWLMAVALVTLIVANLIAAFPARAAARTRPALVLRSE
jgi:ABC-type antimicrobial peptide transport system permease subunit